MADGIHRKNVVETPRHRSDIKKKYGRTGWLYRIFFVFRRVLSINLAGFLL